jgi:hypothetical protein
MINKKWKSEFEKFLNSKNLFELFNSNYSDENISFHIDIYDDSNHAYDYFTNAFDWDFTEEGGDFWDNINEEWYDYIEKEDLLKYDILFKSFE